MVTQNHKIKFNLLPIAKTLNSRIGAVKGTVKFFCPVCRDEGNSILIISLVKGSG